MVGTKRHSSSTATCHLHLHPGQFLLLLESLLPSRTVPLPLGQFHLHRIIIMYYFKVPPPPFIFYVFVTNLIIQGGSTALLCEGVGLRGPRVGLGLEGSRGGVDCRSPVTLRGVCSLPWGRGGVGEGGRRWWDGLLNMRCWGVATGLPRRLCPSDRTASVFYALIWNIDVSVS